MIRYLIKKIYRIYQFIKRPGAFSSAVYWENHYKNGGNSGEGSYKHLAAFKADVLNNLFAEYNIHRVIEFGCGDGNLLSLLRVPVYIGLDISETILKKCILRFHSDSSKSFFLYNGNTFADNLHLFTSEAAISIDVLFHLVELNVYEKYLQNLFSCASKIVIIYSADKDFLPATEHELFRKFTVYIENHFPEWKLEKKIKNKYPVEEYGFQEGSVADFYLFTKRGSLT